MIRSAVLVVFSALLFASCSKKPSEQQCEALKLHIAELVMKDEGSATIGSAGEFVGLLDDNASQYCDKEISKARVTCALAAKTLEDAKRCDE